MSLGDDIELLTRSLDEVLSAPHEDDARGALWDELLELGACHPFQNGAEDWRLGAAIVRAAGRHATGLPLAENVVGSFVLAQAGLPWQRPRLTLADPLLGPLILEGTRVRGTLYRVPHVSVSSHVLAGCEGPSGERHLALVEVRGAIATAGRSVAGEPRDTLQLNGSPAHSCTSGPFAAEALHWLGALMRAGQMLGLGEWVLASSLEHVRTREQFGRPLSAFQAVRHLLSELAGEVATTQMAVTLADRCVARAGLDNLLEAVPAIAAARCQTSTLCELAIRVGHQLHGAMGYTREHGLHARTLRLMLYRSDFGHSEAHARWLGRRAMSLGADRLWTDVLGQVAD